jgi:hypothetical protein
LPGFHWEFDQDIPLPPVNLNDSDREVTLTVMLAYHVLRYVDLMQPSLDVADLSDSIEWRADFFDIATDFGEVGGLIHRHRSTSCGLEGEMNHTHIGFVNVRTLHESACNVKTLSVSTVD